MTKQCIHMELQIKKTYALDSEKISAPIYNCKVKDSNLYNRLLDMGYESSFLSTICPFYSQMNKIAECPCYCAGKN